MIAVAGCIEFSSGQRMEQFVEYAAFILIAALPGRELRTNRNSERLKLRHRAADRD